MRQRQLPGITSDGFSREVPQRPGQQVWAQDHCSVQGPDQHQGQGQGLWLSQKCLVALPVGNLALLLVLEGTEQWQLFACEPQGCVLGALSIHPPNPILGPAVSLQALFCAVSPNKPMPVTPHHCHMTRFLSSGPSLLQLLSLSPDSAEPLIFRS